MKNNATNDKEEKYFFTANIFDEDHIEEEPEELPPPPPTFSEAELESARQQGYRQGHNEGVRETEQSALRHAAQTLDQIAVDMTALFAAEKAREKMYEEDAIKLCLQVFEKLFPFYNETHGFGELKAALDSILKKQEGQQKILICVAPEVAESVAKHLEPLQSNEDSPDLLVKSDPSIALGGCKLSWHEGGAARNPAILAGEIKSMIEQALAGSASKGHDSTDGPAPGSPAPNSGDAQ